MSGLCPSRVHSTSSLNRKADVLRSKSCGGIIFRRVPRLLATRDTADLVRVNILATPLDALTHPSLFHFGHTSFSPIGSLVASAVTGRTGLRWVLLF